jgi:DNA repair ATPase RecN
MKITKISILNFLGVAAFKTNRLGKLNKLTGGNGTGKSSVLKAITEAFKSSGVDPNLVKVGEDRAEILIEIDEKVLVERKITAGSNQAKVVVNGQPLSAPQKWLSDLFAPYQFDPTGFFLAKPKERRSMLLSSIAFRLDPKKLFTYIGDPEDAQMLNLEQYDFSMHGLELLGKIAADIYDRRHEQNLAVTRLKKALEQDRLDIPETFDAAKWQGFDLVQVTDRIAAMRQEIMQHENAEAELEDLRGKVRSINTGIERKESEIERLKAEIHRLEAEIVADRKEAADVQNRGKALKQRVESFVRPDVDSLKKQIEEYHQAQKLVNKLAEIERKEAELESESAIHQDLDRLHKLLVNDVPRKALAEIKLPIKGLEIKGDDIVVDGHSIDTLSTSEQIRFAVNIARSLAGKLKVICVDRYESLDADARKVFEKECETDDFEYFMTQVTSGALSLETQQPVSPPADSPRQSSSVRTSSSAAAVRTGDVGF